MLTKTIFWSRSSKYPCPPRFHPSIISSNNRFSYGKILGCGPCFYLPSPWFSTFLSFIRSNSHQFPPQRSPSPATTPATPTLSKDIRDILRLYRYHSCFLLALLFIIVEKTDYFTLTPHCKKIEAEVRWRRKTVLFGTTDTDFFAFYVCTHTYL